MINYYLNRSMNCNTLSRIRVTGGALGAHAPPDRRKTFLGQINRGTSTPRQRVHPRSKARVQFLEKIGEMWTVLRATTKKRSSTFLGKKSAPQT